MISQWLVDEKHFLDFAVNVGVVLAALSGLVGIAYALRSWYQDDADPAADRHEMLLQFRELNRQGHLSEDEFRSIKCRLVDGAEDSAADRKTDLRTDADAGTAGTGVARSNPSDS